MEKEFLIFLKYIFPIDHCTFSGKMINSQAKIRFATPTPNGLTNGIYLCKVTVNNQTAVKKMIIAK